MTTKPYGHTAIAPKGAHPWTRGVHCAAGGCGLPLVWVEGSGRKTARWQHDRQRA